MPGLGGSILYVPYEDSYRPLHEICERDRNQWGSGIVRLWPALADSFPSAVPELGELCECRLDDLAGRSRALEISYQGIPADESPRRMAL